MIRTQVYLDENQANQISWIAKTEKQDKAKIIRLLIDEGIKSRNLLKKQSHSLLGLAKLGKHMKLKGPTDLSTSTDQYLYK